MLDLARKVWRALTRGQSRPPDLAADDEARSQRLRDMGFRIGARCRIYCIDLPAEPFLVTIGDDVGIAGGVKILTHNGAARMLKQQRPLIQFFGAVTIGDNCFIGENAILLPGVRLGRGCIVAAGAVVHGEFPDNTMVVGNPARGLGRASLFLERLNVSPGAIDTFAMTPEARRAAILDRLGAER